MPNKTIYVSDSDLPVFERAQELAGGNLSATIAKALHGLVEREEGAKQGFEEIQVTVGRNVHVSKRFVGRLLVEGNDGPRRQPWKTTYAIYQTQKGRFALHIHTEPNWEFSDPEASEDFDETEPQEYRLDVFDTIEDLRDAVPRELYDAAVIAERGENIEFLDI